ncbi:hypothetical protein GCM10010309_74160 [Streptomyces violaceochromogenes]|nr:hypothetical protein GCM10010309_74160 [Streptomyces violaceochromogenes]
MPELRKTPRHRSAIRYVWPSATPTRLLPAPMPFSSRARTVCRMPDGNPGSTVRANRVFRVLAGGSLRCALCAASTSPVRASATTQDSAETFGTRDAPAPRRTWVPGRYSREGCGAAALGPPGGVGSAPPGSAVAAVGVNAMSPARQRTPADTVTREGNPMVI